MIPLFYSHSAFLPSGASRWIRAVVFTGGFLESSFFLAWRPGNCNRRAPRFAPRPTGSYPPIIVGPLVTAATCPLLDDASSRSSPASTETVCPLGLVDQLVGITHECDYPFAGQDQAGARGSALETDRMSPREVDEAVGERPRRGQSLHCQTRTRFGSSLPTSF